MENFKYYIGTFVSVFIISITCIAGYHVYNDIWNEFLEDIEGVLTIASLIGISFTFKAVKYLRTTKEN
ncbi:hypothetical protein [Flammeovirga agarivorans]|uniref:Uncharacterized protein n=1 Tax=Flammeovirga agarivorans TaxID=2726742 RepID=A0A7X8XYB5_9BACT|nr:hypothetical protein [Flammeovirga agarivorans]NLR94052.1 hypothetical protein [Flammeovirga agarivorans]